MNVPQSQQFQQNQKDYAEPWVQTNSDYNGLRAKDEPGHITRLLIG